jgi:hypothetical protein
LYEREARRRPGDLEELLEVSEQEKERKNFTCIMAPCGGGEEQRTAVYRTFTERLT